MPHDSKIRELDIETEIISPGQIETIIFITGNRKSMIFSIM